MTHWIETKAGLQMALIIAKYLPRITVSLEEIAKKDKCYKEWYDSNYNDTKINKDKIQTKEVKVPDIHRRGYITKKEK